MKECKYKNEKGCCTQVNANRKCENYISSSEWFDDSMRICDVDEVCENRSPFGNNYFKITKEQLKALKKGKVLYYVDEYGTFIILEA